MAKSYENPNFNITRTAGPFRTVAGNGTVGAHFFSYQKAKLKAAHILVITAGTSAGAGNSLVVKNGTTALATATLGTSAAGVTTSLDLGDSSLASLTALTVTNGTDATGVNSVAYEYEVDPSAEFSS